MRRVSGDFSLSMYLSGAYDGDEPASTLMLDSLDLTLDNCDGR
jgi:hypothetical protein